MTRRLIAEYVAPRDHPQRVESRRKLALLSDRERDVLTLIGRGLSNADAAQNLFMSEATIKTYVSRMLTKLELTNRTQAAILAHEAASTTEPQPRMRMETIETISTREGDRQAWVTHLVGATMARTPR